MAFANVYTHRKVAEGSARGCEICFKPSTSVLITPEKEDFFYICAKHLKERAFCTPIIDKVQLEAKKKREEEEKKEKALKEEMERVKKEYEAKQKKKKKDQHKDEDKSKDKDGEEDKGKEKDEKSGDDRNDDKAKDASESAKEAPKQDEARIFALQKFVYQQRLEKKRQTEIAKRNRERLSNPSFFPSVPKSAP